MKQFNRKWRNLTQLARTGKRQPDEVPEGFVEEVLASVGRVRQRKPRATNSEWIWLHLGLETLGGVTAVLVLFLVLTDWRPEPQGTLRPPVENSIVEACRIL